MVIIKLHGMASVSDKPDVKLSTLTEARSWARTLAFSAWYRCGRPHLEYVRLLGGWIDACLAQQVQLERRGARAAHQEGDVVPVVRLAMSVAAHALPRHELECAL
jgi:hypothetical protein